MHILVTRPEADAATLKVPLESMGHRVSLAPMIEIDFADADPIDVSDCSGLVATSRNGLRGLQVQRAHLPSDVAQMPLFAVGPGTAALARTLGFAHVSEGPGSGAELVPVIAAAVKPRAGALLHLAGDTLAYDLRAALIALGYAVRQPVVYRSRAAAGFAPGVAIDIAHGAIDAVILMSPKSAQTFVNLATERGLASAARKSAYICLSEAVAAQLAVWQPLSIKIALRPNLEEILMRIEGLNSPFR